MQTGSYPFANLPFPKLFQSYLSDFGKVAPFYEADPFDEKAIRKYAKQKSALAGRKQKVDALRAINKPYDPEQPTLDNLDRLEQEDTLAVVTGQQLGVYGGPLYTFLKTLTTIHLARRMEKLLDRPVVPVFWLADEDHDYDEIRSVTVLNEDDPLTFSLPSKGSSLPPVSQMTFEESLEDLRDELKQAQYDTDFSSRLWELLDAGYAKGKRFDKAFGTLFMKLFSKYGLVLAGSNNKAVKELSRECMKSAIEGADGIRQALQQQTDALSEEFSQQVTLYDSNLFYLGDGARQKISRNGDGWQTDAGRKWDTGDLIKEIESSPEKFSPNVFLRPVLQDVLLPTLGYVGGPGEISYYGQMKQMYKEFDMRMPVIFPRLSATFIEPAINRIMGELPFELHHYGQRIEDLESQFVKQRGEADIESIFSEWRQKVEEISQKPVGQIAEIDPTLEKAADKAATLFQNELDRLKGKVYRSVKDHEQTQLNRIRRIQNHLFPGRTLQERSLAGIYFMNKYDIDIWDRLLEALDKDDNFSEHKLVYL